MPVGAGEKTVTYELYGDKCPKSRLYGARRKLNCSAGIVGSRKASLKRGD